MSIKNPELENSCACNYDCPLDVPHKVTHVIVELDGIMIDTGPIFKEIYSRLAAEYNKQFTNDLHMKLMGTNYKVRAELMIKALGLPLSVPQFVSAFKFRCVEALKYDHINLVEGAERLVNYFASHQVPFCLATGNPESTYQLKIKQNAEVFSNFCHHVCGDTDADVKLGKPHPDLFLVAASRFRSRPAPANCLVFDKSPNGKQAAIAAGMRVVMLPDPKVPKEDCFGATEILKSLLDFRPEKYGLPKFKTGLY